MTESARTPQDRPGGLLWRVPPAAWAAMAVFLVIQALALAGFRGVGDPELYPFDPTKHVPVSAFEDDGAINVAAALNLLPPGDRFSSLINIGGPYLWLGRAGMAVAARLGLCVRFDDPWLYVLYPQAYAQAWRLLGWVKLLFFLPFFPLVLYWIGANHLTPRTGVLAAWLLAVIPFITGFEVRLKADAPAMIAGLFALLFLFQHQKTGRLGQLLAAAAFLGLSLAMKLSMVPAVFLLVLVVWDRWRKAGEASKLGDLATPLALAAACCLGAFVAANPLVLPGAAAYLNSLLHSSAFLTVPTEGGLGAAFSALARRLYRFDTFYGPALNILILPALAASVWSVVQARSPSRPEGLLLVFLLVNAAYLLIVAQALLPTVTYYFYQPAVILLLLAASGIDRALGAAERAGPFFRLTALAGLGLVFLLTLRVDLDVLAYLRQPTNRQAAHAFLEQAAERGAVVGLPIDPGAEVFSRFFGLDPFRFRLVEAGRDGRELARIRPEWLIWVVHEPGQAPPPDPAYLLVARFEAGRDLPHERYDLYQEHIYEIYHRTTPADHPAGTDPAGDALYALGGFVRSDPEPNFNILQIGALHIRPISLDILRKTASSLLPMPTATYAATTRHVSSPLAYAHQVDRLTLAFWGVKYLLVRADDPAFDQDSLGSGRFGFTPLGRLDAGDLPEDRRPRLFANDDYLGQAIFLPDPDPGEVVVTRPPRLFGWTRPLRTWGRLFGNDEMRGHGDAALEIELAIETDCPTDIVLKGGTSRRSLLAGPGFSRLIASYEPGGLIEDIGYEIHPTCPGGRVVVHELKAGPLRPGRDGTIFSAVVTPGLSFVSVAAERPGRVVFALPYHGHFTATVNGRPAPVMPGPAGVAAVPVPAGRHFLALRFSG